MRGRTLIPPAGLEQSLKFQCGVNGELNVDGWETSKTPAK